MFIENKYVNRKLKKGGNSVPPASVIGFICFDKNQYYSEILVQFDSLCDLLKTLGH
jgi:hypothetical protein